MSESYTVHCDCNSVEVTMHGNPRVHAFCHCEDCRDLLQVPYHSVLAWEADQVAIIKGHHAAVTFQHPQKRMQRIFCKHCGDVLYNTNAMGWKLISQLLFTRCNGTPLPEALVPNVHFFYARRVVDIDDNLPKR